MAKSRKTKRIQKKHKTVVKVEELELEILANRVWNPNHHKNVEIMEKRGTRQYTFISRQEQPSYARYKVFQPRRLALHQWAIVKKYGYQPEFTPIDLLPDKWGSFGAFASLDIPKDTYIGQYTGDFYSNNQMLQFDDKTRQRLQSHALFNSVFNIVRDKSVSYPMMLNHDDNPNCRIQGVETQQNTIVMLLIANQDIKKGDQLTWNYYSGKNGEKGSDYVMKQPTEDDRII